MADDELEAIQAIFCRPGEVCVLSGGDDSKDVTVKLSPDCHDENEAGPQQQQQQLDAELCLSLSSSYPATPPQISIRSSSLARKDISSIRAALCEIANQNLGLPMLLDLINAASEELQRAREEDRKQGVSVRSDTATEQGSGEDVDRLAVLHLDHMRARTQYVKLINKWAAELGLRGRLVFCQRLIIIVLQGSSMAIKDYIVRQRTSSVDVDSRGLPCKERMLSVACDLPLDTQHARFADFGTVELTTADDLKKFFTKWSLQDIFSEYITTLKHFPGR